MSKISLICLLLIVGSSICEEKVEAVEFPTDEKAQGQESTDPQAGQSQEKMGINQDQQKQAQEEMRQVIISCILFTKHYFHNNQKHLTEVLEYHGKESQIQAPLYKKIFSVVMEQCYQHMNYQESQKFFEDIQKESFSLAPYEHLAENFDWNFYAKPDVDTVLNPMQQSLYKNAEDFDKMMKDRQKEQEGGEEDESQYERKPEDYEPKIMGVSVNSSPLGLKLIYLLAILAFFGGLIAFGFSKLSPTEIAPKKKGKKAKAN